MLPASVDSGAEASGEFEGQDEWGFGEEDRDSR